MSDVLAVVRSATIGELCWVDSAGQPQVCGVVPLATGSRPVLAFPYSDAAVALSAARAEQVVLTLTEHRSTGSDWQPTALHCTPLLREDPEGEWFCAELLHQELRKYPPSRTLADSVLLRREHWWWLPRLLVDLEVRTSTPIAPRSSAADHLLVTAGAVAVVSLDLTDPAAPVISSPPARVAPGEAVLFRQDLTFPDLEQWAQWTWRGHWDGSRFSVTSAPEAVGLPPTPGVLARWRRQRALERACRSGLGGAVGHR